MAGEVIHGLTVRISKEALVYPEFRERCIGGLYANLAHKVTTEGLQMLGAPVIVREIPVAFVKVNHHAHGWQMDEVQVAPEDAEQWLIVAEVICAAR